MGIEGYGLNPGCSANFNLLQARDSIEAIRLRAHRLAVVRKGYVIAKNAPINTEISLDGRGSRSSCGCKYCEVKDDTYNASTNTTP